MLEQDKTTTKKFGPLQYIPQICQDISQYKNGLSNFTGKLNGLSQKISRFP
jgi:hypothetical protein